MKIDSSSDEKVGQINGFKLLLSTWLQSTILIVNYYPDIRIIRISVSALVWKLGYMKSGHILSRSYLTVLDGSHNKAVCVGTVCFGAFHLLGRVYWPITYDTTSL